jgi:hypothetical protein
MFDLQTIVARNNAPQRAESTEERVEVFKGTYKRALLVYVAIKRAHLPARLFSSSGGRGAVTSVPEAQPIADYFQEEAPQAKEAPRA